MKESLRWLEKARWRQKIGASAFPATRIEEENLCPVCLCVKMANSLAEWGFFFYLNVVLCVIGLNASVWRFWFLGNGLPSLLIYVFFQKK
ncbi:hypothetical protein TorRG33x02_140280 [Trema orientale]|uniref:Transmembrane protein n=1 Tax=Trema orientale TaxID=63057 RepID=A0A2P5EXB3_TREOI|nr:hypothetical protein TorRG33x02_140280 [Trema orientale]